MGCRLLYGQLITAASMIAVSSQRNGIVTDALKDGTGSAVITTSGNYSGDEDLEYTVEIDSVSGGAEVGSATFRWSKGAGAWEASGVATSSTNILLENGIYVRWASGSGDDFAVGDKWYFKGLNPFGKDRLLDFSRNTRYRSSALESPNTLTIDLGSAQQVKTLVLYDHNFTSAATLAIRANTAADSWGSPAFSESVTWADSKIIHYLSSAQTYRYWRIEVTDAANGDGYIEIAELWLSGYLELSETFSWDYTQGLGLVLASQATPYGVNNRRYYNRQRIWEYDFEYLPDTDITAILAMIEAITNQASGTICPVIWNPDSSAPGTSWQVEIDGLTWRRTFTDHNHIDGIEMREVLRSV